MAGCLDDLCINAVRLLSVDAIQAANSGHPGLPMGAAPMAYALWKRFLKHNPRNPGWWDRDRFVLSGGHGSMLLYSLLYLTGYDVSLDDLKQFRQWESKTPGHPERGETPGVEVTTGPLGQGFGNGVGMAMAEAHLAARFNRPGHEIINHYTYAIVSDGDLMEGVAAEAASLAGHLKLGKLIYLYDSNDITLSGTLGMSCSDDTAKRFESYGWQVITVENGNSAADVEKAIAEARADTARPSLIIAKTTIGYGSPGKQGTFEVHGAPLGADEILLTKKNLGWPSEEPFFVPEEALACMREAVAAGEEAETAWNARFAAYESAYPELAAEMRRAFAGELPDGWESSLPVFPADAKGLATRASSGKVLNAAASVVTTLFGGSADLNPSTLTALAGMGDFQPPHTQDPDSQGSVGNEWGYAGRNVWFGIREHAMGSIMNGIAAHGGLLPYGATFLPFSDYMRPAIRLAALMDLRVIYVFTHDSLAVGEDGPTHQPVEQVAALRTIPNLTVIRPADANETAEAWAVAIGKSSGPVALALTRQNVPTLDRERCAPASGLRRGAYVLAEADGGAPQVVIIGTGSEVHLALAARERLQEQGVRARVVSMPSWELFEAQSQGYREEVLPPGTPALAVEAGVTMGWTRYADDVIGVDTFGASAPGGTVLKAYGFTVENVVERALRLVAR